MSQLHDPAAILLLLLAVGFAISIGAHYTGACMGMPHALGVVTRHSALLLMAPCALAGAALASHGVERTVGIHLTGQPLDLRQEALVIAVAFGLTTLYNRLRLPTSTIQLLVFSLVGVALGSGHQVAWNLVGALVAIWAAAPPIAYGLGFLLTRLLDAMARRPGLVATMGAHLSPHAGRALLLVGLAASFTMGANDVSNASGSLVGTHLLSPLLAGILGGVGLAIGVLLFGGPLLSRVSFDIVRLDREMATASQLVQAAVVLCAVGFGFFTSMNQALVGAMAGAGRARGKGTVNRATLNGILRGWAIGPVSALASGALLAFAGSSLHLLQR